jgi:hypothetical protein
VFSINTNGTGLSTAIVNGVAAVVDAARFDIYVQAYNDPGEVIDVVGNFVLKVEPDPAGGTDPLTGAVCLAIPAQQLADNFTGPKAILVGPDGVNDSITQNHPGPVYCFNVTPKANATVAATNAMQIFRAWLRIRAVMPNGSLAFGQDRELLFLVPASAN